MCPYYTVYFILSHQLSHKNQASLITLKKQPPLDGLQYLSEIIIKREECEAIQGDAHKEK